MEDITEMNLAKLIQHFSEDADCRKLLTELRWPDGARIKLLWYVARCFGQGSGCVPQQFQNHVEL